MRVKRDYERVEDKDLVDYRPEGRSTLSDSSSDRREGWPGQCPAQKLLPQGGVAGKAGKEWN